MAILFNNVGAAVAGGAAVTLLTVPAGAEAMALELKFTPVGGTANLTLTLERQATGVPFNFVTGHAIAAGDIFDFGKIALQEGDTLSFSATGNNINGLVSYYQDGSATTSAGSLNPRGEYAAPATYNRLDVVSYGVTSYIQLNNGITGDAPPSANWMVNASAGVHTHAIAEINGLQDALDTATSYRGTYDAGKPYAVGESVSYTGSMFVKNTTAPTGTTPVDGVDWLEIGGGSVADFQEFTSSGTWTKPDGVNFVYVESLGGGGGGGATLNTGNASPGIGGLFSGRFLNAAALGDTEVVTVGAGGNGGSAAFGVASFDAGDSGGDSTFGAHVTAYGGNGGPSNGANPTSTRLFRRPLFYISGAGSDIPSTDTIEDGARGDSSSLYAGDGGTSASGNILNITGGDGQFPAGGGGLADNPYNVSGRTATGGAGADGRVRVWSW